MESLKRYWVWAIVMSAFLAVGLAPSFWLNTKVATLYYSWLLFAILLSTCVVLLLVASPRPVTKDTEKQERDHRVVHYTIRVALVFAIGAIMVAVLLLIDLLLG